MSEALLGLPPAPPAARVRDSAVAILYRQSQGQTEVYWVKRGVALAFAGGFHAFPGGRVDTADAAVPVEGAQGPDATLRAAAARELFEEAGVLAARGAERVSRADLAAARKELLEQKVGLAEILARHRLVLRASDFVEAGRWITPPFLPIRYDARFFLVELPSGAAAEHWPGELSEGAWIRPADALERWRQGVALLHPPTHHALEVMSDFRGAEAAAFRLRDPPFCPGHMATRIEFQGGIRLFALETPTLPPATHTNAYILGNGDLLIVDPGSSSVRQYAKLIALLSAYKAEGKRPLAVVLTHAHADHMGGAAQVAERLKIEIWAHPRTADRLPFPVHRQLQDGEVLSLAGVPPMKFRVLHTPGHARGHICLLDEASKAAVVGDMVSALGTVVIDPPDGDMGDYVAQLERLRQLPVGTIYPGHGAPILDGPSKLTEYLLHREMRERKVLEALGEDGATLRDVVPKAYDDIAPALHPVAERSTQAILIKLAREGRVARRDDRYYAL